MKWSPKIGGFHVCSRGESYRLPVSHKPSINPVRWTPPPVDALPDFPSAELTIVPMPGDAPEDVVVGPDGTLWTGLVDGRIVRVSPDSSVDVVADTGGRPLGLHVARDGRVLVCDSYRGLMSLDPGTGALDVLVPDIDGRPLRFCSNVTETADGTALVFAETQGRRLSKYWLSGPQAGTITPLAVNLPGMPDNISTGADGRIWVAFVTPINAVAEWLAPRPTILRQLVWRLPEALQPQMSLEVWAVAFDPDSGAAVAGVRGRHRQFGQVTGLVEHDGRLWMSSIGVPALAHCALPERV